MKIVHRYIAAQLLRNFLLSIGLFSVLFLMIDFFDRIDNIIAAGGSLSATCMYFLYKLPLTINLMLPISMLVATLFTFGILSKNSELTAMRASGLSVAYLCRPLFIIGIGLSLASLLMNETIVPIFTRRVSEIYNIDIQKKDQNGSYSQNDVWLREGNRFLSIDIFDSRTDTMHNVSIFDLQDDFDVSRRIDARESGWLGASHGWSLIDVNEYQFQKGKDAVVRKMPAFPLPITDEPESFYDTKTDSSTMSYRSLRQYIKRLSDSGVPTARLVTDLNEKLAFPFISFIASFVALPFAVKPARSGGIAMSFIAGLLIGFSYYVVHSYTIALGRAEIFPPFAAAWAANMIMGFVGLLLYAGVESPR